MMFSRVGMLIALLALLTGCAAPLVRAPEPMAAPAAWSARIDAAAATTAGTAVASAIDSLCACPGCSGSGAPTGL